MKSIEIFNEETRDVVYLKSSGKGYDFYLSIPVGEELKSLWEERHELFFKEIEIEEEFFVKDKVWSETYVTGEQHFEHNPDFYIQKDVLKRKLKENELKFLNAYRNRFLFLKEVTNEVEKYFVYDNETQIKHEAKVSDGSLHNFKILLKKLLLI